MGKVGHANKRGISYRACIMRYTHTSNSLWLFDKRSSNHSALALLHDNASPHSYTSDSQRRQRPSSPAVCNDSSKQGIEAKSGERATVDSLQLLRRFESNFDLLTADLYPSVQVVPAPAGAMPRPRIRLAVTTRSKRGQEREWRAGRRR